MKLVECVPNFSEGRDRRVIEAIAEAIRGTDGAELLDVDPGAGANRTVVTFVASPAAAVEAGFRAIRTAAELIDMRLHQGEHPRIGATDVFPFVPVSGTTMGECARLARELGRRVAEELGIPVYLYERAATRPERRALSAIRAGEYEGLAAKLADPAWAPDFGAPEFNARSGATVIGARKFLAAYNVNLNTTDHRLAARVAGAIREQGRPIRAIGWFIPEYGCAQVSMNLVDLDRAGLHDAFDEAVRQADALGLRVTGSELVGLVPESAMLAAGRHYLLRQGKSPGAGPDDLVAAAVRTLGLNDVTRFDPDARIIERRLRRPDRLGALPLERFVGRVAAATPTPGGGSCAALAAACSGALAGMAAGIAWERKGFEAVREELGRAALAAQDAARAALEAIDADARAYDAVVAASRLPRATPEDAARRDAAIDRASRAAAEVPLGIIERLGGLVDAIDAVVRRGSPACLSDAIGAASLAAAAAETAHANVLANLPAVRDARWTRRVRERADRRRADVAGRARAILARARRALARAAAPPGRKGGR